MSVLKGPRPFLPEDITAAWLSEVLSERFDGTRVLSVKRDEPIWGNAGKVPIHLEYNDAGIAAGLPPTMFVKGRLGLHPERDFDFIYETETSAYAKVVPLLDVNAPACYYAGSTAGSSGSGGSAILLIEDLNARPGIRFQDARTKLTLDEVTRFMDSLARMHAPWLSSPELDPGGSLAWVPPAGSAGFTAYIEHVSSPQIWDSFMQLPRAADLPEEFKDGRRMAAAIKNQYARHARGPLCLTHGDCHVGNTFMDADHGPGFFDWVARRAPWYKDVPYFLISATDVADRREWEVDMLTYYLERLGEYGAAAPPTFDQAWDDYRREIIHGLFIWATCSTDFQLEPINCIVTGRFAEAASDHGTLDLLAG